MFVYLLLIQIFLFPLVQKSYWTSSHAYWDLLFDNKLNWLKGEYNLFCSKIYEAPKFYPKQSWTIKIIIVILVIARLHDIILQCEEDLVEAR